MMAEIILSGVAVTVCLFITYKFLKRSLPLNFENKVVLITGASCGLGEALAHKFYEAGAKIILSSRNIQELQRVKTSLENSKIVNINKPIVHLLDLNDLESIPTRALKGINLHDGIDVLINNGGMSYRGEVMNTTIDVDQRLMMVNYFGHVALTKAILPSMLIKKSGVIVGISSLQGRFSIPYRSAYAASKHAFQAFFDCLRAEISDSNIHVCIVSPGYIKTSLSLNALTGQGRQYGVMDQTTDSGMDPQYAAQLIFKAVMFQKNEIILAKFTHRFVIHLRSLFPDVYFYIMRKRAAKQKSKSE